MFFITNFSIFWWNYGESDGLSWQYHSDKNLKHLISEFTKSFEYVSYIKISLVFDHNNLLVRVKDTVDSWCSISRKGQSIKDIRFFEPFFDLPTHPSPIITHCNVCGSIVISNFWKPTYPKIGYLFWMPPREVILKWLKKVCNVVFSENFAKWWL